VQRGQEAVGVGEEHAVVAVELVGDRCRDGGGEVVLAGGVSSRSFGDIVARWM
jgi:hypothetical protein